MEICLSIHDLSCCGLFKDILQQKPVSAERTGKAAKGGRKNWQYLYPLFYGKGEVKKCLNRVSSMV